MIVKYEYKLVDKINLQSLNEEGQQGWMVIDRHYGNALLMRPINEQ
jgi:hypothetical protein